MPVDPTPYLELYDEGKYVTAWEQLRPHGGLRALAGPQGRALAGRLAVNLGADRYGRAIHLRAWRAEPHAAALGYYVAMALAQLRGPVAALQFLDELGVAGLAAEALADIGAARAYLLASLHDFRPAEKALQTALQQTPTRPWLQVVRGVLLSAQDRPAEALEAYQQSLEFKPWYRPGVQAAANEMMKLDRVDQARELLMGAGEHLESGYIHLQMAQLEREMSQYEIARKCVQAALPLLPMYDRDRDGQRNIVGLQATLAYDCGDIDRAIELSRKAGGTFHETVARNLEENRDVGRRVILDVGFTLQYDATCVPATLSTLSKFWDQPNEHVEIADAICYDGTPAHAEREWLEEHGFFCREFTLTWEAAQALIDAGLPFTQSLVGYSMGHMQAVIGYDSLRGVLIIRDPNRRHAEEALAKELLEQMRSSGPRGMVFVPMAQRRLVEAIELPDDALWEANFALSRRLDRHDRAGAAEAHERMKKLAPEHRLTIYAAAQIAAYDGDLRRLGKLTDVLLKAFPDDQNQWSVKLRVLRQLGTRSERLDVLERLCNKRVCEAVYRQQYLEELLEDPASAEQATYFLRRCLRAGMMDGQTCALAARRLWTAGRRDEALKWFRFAVCVDDKVEARAKNYFFAARALNRTDEALEMLKDRFQRFGNRNGGPARSLVEALDQLYQTPRAAKVLEQALAARSGDGELKLFAGEFFSRIGQFKQSQKQLVEAKGLCHAADWHSAAAQFEWQRNRPEKALAHLDKSLSLGPLNIDVQRRMCEALADARGPAAAVEHMRQAVQEFPNHYELRMLLVETASLISPEVVEKEVREFVKRHPHDPWGWRELGFRLVQQRRWQEAFAAAKRARELEPQAEQNDLLLALVYRGVGKHDRAYKALLSSVGKSADYVAAISELMRLCDTRDERRKALAVVFQELRRQVVHGESLLLVQQFVRTSFEPVEGLRLLLEARQARPDLWQTWSAVIRQMLEMRRHDDALKAARQAAKKFPLLPQTLLDLADVYVAQDDHLREREAIDRALAIDSRNGLVLRRSAEAYRQAGDVPQQRKALERACASEPRDVTHRGEWAALLWAEGERREAVAAIREAIQMESDYEWGWNQLTTWAWTMGEPQQLIEFAESMTELRPKSAEIWARRAQVLTDFPDQYDACLAAVDRAIQLDPRRVDTHALRAGVLAGRGEFDRALAACQSAELGGERPLQLASHAAVIVYQRGDMDGAIERMRDVTKQDPYFAYAWSRLADWLGEKGEAAEALQCAERLLEVAPDSATSWGYVADALLAVDKRSDAVEKLKRAIAIDPSYLFGGQTLMKLQVEDEDYEEALVTLRTIGSHLASIDRDAQEARLLALEGQPKESLQAFRAACRAVDGDTTLLDDAVDALLRTGHAALLRETLLRATETSDLPAPLSGLLVEVLLREGLLTDVDEFYGTLPPGSPHWNAAMTATIEALGNAQAAEKLHAVVVANEAGIKQCDTTWAAVGGALQECGLNAAAIRWMEDWQARQGIEAWQLVPLGLAALMDSNVPLALEVAARAEAAPHGPVADALRLVGASAEMLRGDPAAAAQQLVGVTPTALTPYCQGIFFLVATACELVELPDEETRWSDVARRWREIVERHRPFPPDEAFDKIVAHCELAVVQQHGHWMRQWRCQLQVRRADRRRVRVQAARQKVLDR